MRPVTVVVAFKLVQHDSGVSLIDDQEAVEELATDRPDEALRDRICAAVAGAWLVAKALIRRCDRVIGTHNALHGHAPDDVASHRTRAGWYTTKTEPSYDDMTIKLRRVIIAARFCSRCPEQATPQETQAVLAAWAVAST